MKKQYIFLLAAIAVLSAYIALRSPDKVNYELPDLPEIQKNDISAVEMEKQGKRLVLKKDGGAWKTDPDKYPASDDQVDRILDAIAGLTLTDMVSQAKSYDRFDLTDDKKLTVRVFSQDTLTREFDMGSVAGTNQHTFVKIAGDPRVYHARGNLHTRFTVHIDDVRDKTVMMFNPHEIRKVQVGHEDRFLDIVRVKRPESQAGDAAPGEGGPDHEKSGLPEKDGSWKSDNDEPVDEAALERLLASVSDLKCRSYVYDREKDTFSDPRYFIKLIGVKTFSLFFYATGEKDVNTFTAVSSENNSPFVLDQRKADELVAGIEAMMKSSKTDVL